MPIAGSGVLNDNSVTQTGSCVNAARATAVAVMGLAIVVMAGYTFHVDSLITLKNGLQGMSLLTALAIFILSVTLLAQSWERTVIEKLGAWLAITLGFGLLFVEGINGADTVSPQLEIALGFDPKMGARVSIATAVCVGTLGLAILTTSRAVVADFLALSVSLIASFALLGYAYGVRELYALPFFHTMAMHTATALLVLSLVSILIRPRSNWCAVVGARTESGAATRRQLLFMALPVGVGWLLLRAINFQAIGPAAAMAFLVIATVASLGILILRDGRRIVQIDQERRSSLEMHEALNAEMKLRLRAQAEEISSRSAQQALAETAALKAQRLEALSRLTGGIAHDFNNLLQAIGGGVELIGKRAREGQPINTLLDGVRVAMQRGAKLGSQLLTFSRTQKLNIRAMALDELLGNARPTIESAVGSQIAVRYDFRTSGQIILTDDAQFELALLNLALNAKDAMGGRGELTLATSLEATTATDEGGSQFVSVRVSDTGEGMSPEVLARALEPFFSTKPEGTASGLGLAQVHGLMRQCHGEVKLTSEPGRGTTVELRFSTLRELPTSTSIDVPHAAQVPAVQSQGLIVVIEDDEAVRRVIVENLKEARYEVAEAGDGEAGIALLKSLKPAAAVIDFLMPNVTGADVAKIARADRPDLPIVFISGHFETAALEGFRHAVILRKPFEFGALRATLVDLMNRFREP